MDQFELARQKNDKRLERLARTTANTQSLVEAPRVQEPPKEKAATTSAVIEVKVSLPDREFSFTLVKPMVYQNAIPSKLNRNGILNAVQDGLRPLLGGVKEQ